MSARDSHDPDDPRDPRDPRDSDLTLRAALVFVIATCLAALCSGVLAVYTLDLTHDVLMIAIISVAVGLIISFVTLAYVRAREEQERRRRR